MRILEIYKEKFRDATTYLKKARKMKDELGSGFSVVYCWFYSVPQRWILLEPKIFAIANRTNNFNLNFLLQTSSAKLAELTKTLMFHNKISLQLKNFCKAIRNEYFSWDIFVEEIKKESIFNIFKILNRYSNIRVTFKNLAAMKIFIGQEDDLLILDTHVANTLGINKNELYKYRRREDYFKSLLKLAYMITDRLKHYGLAEVTTAQWSLSIWFYETKTSSEVLLNY
jgi:uncharacterized membrane protein YkvA (DUF1232 family)